MKKLLYMSGAMLLALTACDDDYNNQFDLDSPITDIKNGEFTLTDDDYATISTLPDNKEKALAQDPEGESYLNALKEVGKKKYFNNMITAEEYVPAFIANKYPNADNGSRFVIKSNTYKEPSGYLKDFENIGIYTLSEADYKTVWGAYTHAQFLSPSSVNKIPALLKDNVKGAAVGDMRVVNYAFSETEPSTGGDAPIIYSKVSEFDGEAANYVIVAKADNGKYYPFGKLQKPEYNYGYIKPDPIEIDGNVINNEVGADLVVTLEKTAKGFALKNTWGQYLFMKGTFDSFNVSSSLPKEGGEWTVKSNGNGTFSFVNTLTKKTIKLNYFEKDGVGSYSFGAYADTKFAGTTYYAGVDKATKEGGFKVTNIALPGTANTVWTFEDGKYGIFWKASGHVGGKEGKDFPCEGWLVSKQIDLSKAKTPQLTIDMVLNFLKGQKRSDYVNVYVAEDYTTDVKTATWKEVTVSNWPSGKDYDHHKAVADLAAYKGKKINLAFKYVSTDKYAPTWQVGDIKIADVTKYWDVCLYKETIDDGTNSRAMMSRADVAANTSDLFVLTSDGWKEYSNKDARVAVVDPSVYASIGKNEIKNAAAVLPVFLQNKYPYAEEGNRAAVVYNKKSDAPAVVEYTYKSGVWAETLPYETTSVTYVKENGLFVAQMSTYLDETFLGNEGGFVVQNVNLGTLNFVWQNTEVYGWKASAFANKKQNPSESWIVSPVINFKKAIAPELVYDEAINFANGANVTDFFKVKVSTDYTGDVTACTWETLKVEGGAEGSSWDFFTINPISLSKYVGKTTVYIAFQYVSTDTVAPTVEIKNLKVVEHED